MDVTKLIPVGAGTPPAAIVGLELYKGVSEAALPVFQASTPILAGFVAIVGVIAMLGGEIYSYDKAFEAFARKQSGAGALSLIAGLICSALVVYAILNAEGGRAVIVSAVIVSILIYVVSGVGKLLKIAQEERARKDAAAKENADRLEREQVARDNAEALRIKAEVAIEQARARAANADAKKVIAQQAQVSESFPKVSETFDDWRKVPADVKARIAGMTKAEVMAEFGKSEKTAGNWIANAQKEAKQ